MCGLSEFTDELIFDSSLFVTISKCISEEELNKMTLSLLQEQKHHKEEGKHLEEQPNDSNQNPPASTVIYSLLHSKKSQKDMNTKKA